MKKILSLILAVFILLGAVIPTAHAVQLFGENITYGSRLQFPPVTNKEGVTNFTFDSNNTINSGVSSLVCINKGNQGECDHFIATVTPVLFVDTKNLDDYNIEQTYVQYPFFGETLKVYVSRYDEENIYFSYYTSLSGEVPLAKISRNQNCGSKNPNACIVAFHFYLQISAKNGAKGVFLQHVDMMKYSREDDTFTYFRDEKASQDTRDMWTKLQDMLTFAPFFGKKIIDFAERGQVYVNSDDGKIKGWVPEKETNLGITRHKFKLVDDFSYINVDQVYMGNNGYALMMTDFSVSENFSADNTAIRDFLVGNRENVNLQSTLADFLGAKGIVSGVVDNNTGEIVTDPNIYGDPNFNKNCGSDLGCHVINGIKLFLGGFFKGLFDGIKIIFDQIAKFFEGIIDGIYVALGKESPKDEEGGFIRDIINNTIVKWHLVLGTGQGLVCDAKFNYSFTDSQKNFIAEEYKKYVPDDSFVYTFFGLFKFINPLPPTDGQEVCTYMGMKSVNYRENSWVDIILVIMFCGMILGLFYRNYN